MLSITHPIAMPAPFARSVAIAALMGATMLASPLTAARADTGTTAAIQLAQAAAPQNPAAAGATETKGGDRRAADQGPSRGAENHARPRF